MNKRTAFLTGLLLLAGTPAYAQLCPPPQERVPGHCLCKNPDGTLSDTGESCSENIPVRGYRALPNGQSRQPPGVCGGNSGISCPAGVIQRGPVTQGSREAPAAPEVRFCSNG